MQPAGSSANGRLPAGPGGSDDDDHGSGSVTIRKGFPDAVRPAVARLFWEAFSGKLGRIMAPEDKALAFLSGALRPHFALTAWGGDNALLGVAGLKTAQGGLVAGGLADLARHYGWVGALWRGPLLDLTERPLKAGQLLMDGLFVAAEARGRGVGTLLIDAVIDEAIERGAHEVRLDVIDSNPRARALYERRGFRVVRVERLRLLRPIFGFSRSATMVRDVSLPSEDPPAARP